MSIIYRSDSYREWLKSQPMTEVEKFLIKRQFMTDNNIGNTAEFLTEHWQVLFSIAHPEIERVDDL